MLIDHNISHHKINVTDNTLYVLIITFIIFAVLFYLILLFLSKYKIENISLLPDNENKPKIH